MVSESKIDYSFPDNQFLFDGYSAPSRLDRKGYNAYKGGRILLFVCDDIPSKEISIEKLPTVIFLVELI